MTDPLARFTDAADVSTWTGLAPGAAEALGIDVDIAPTIGGRRGEPPTAGAWTPLAPRLFSDGLRAWLDDGAVVLIEGTMPLTPDGSFLGIPDLGEPEAALDFVFGPLEIAGGERVYAARGLSVCVNPGSGVLLALRGFAPTSPDDYVRRLRPVTAPALRLAVGRTP